MYTSFVIQKDSLKFKPKLLSVIIPAYRESKTIKDYLLNVITALEEIRIPYEIIVVIDGRIDTTYKQARKVQHPNVKVVGYPHNHGKGYAVRYGTARALGDLIVFMDAGGDINPRGISMLLEHMKWYDADIIVGSKRHLVSQVRYPFIRRIYSLVYQLIVKILFGLRIKDTQVGLKLFKRKVLEDVLPRLLVKRYAFDVEILSVAYFLGYKKIYESPVQIQHKFSSSINRRVIIRMIWDTMSVFYRLRILKYYSDKNQRKWKYDPELNFRVNVG